MQVAFPYLCVLRNNPVEGYSSKVGDENYCYIYLFVGGSGVAVLYIHVTNLFYDYARQRPERRVSYVLQNEDPARKRPGCGGRGLLCLSICT